MADKCLPTTLLGKNPDKIQRKIGVSFRLPIHWLYPMPGEGHTHTCCLLHINNTTDYMARSGGRPVQKGKRLREREGLHNSVTSSVRWISRNIPCIPLRFAVNSWLLMFIQYIHTTRHAASLLHTMSFIVMASSKKCVQTDGKRKNKRVKDCCGVAAAAASSLRVPTIHKCETDTRHYTNSHYAVDLVNTKWLCYVYLFQLMQAYVALSEKDTEQFVSNTIILHFLRENQFI